MKLHFVEYPRLNCEHFWGNIDYLNRCPTRKISSYSIVSLFFVSSNLPFLFSTVHPFLPSIVHPFLPSTTYFSTSRVQENQTSMVSVALSKRSSYSANSEIWTSIFCTPGRLCEEPKNVTDTRYLKVPKYISLYITCTKTGHTGTFP